METVNTSIRVISRNEIEIHTRVNYHECDPQNMAHHSRYVIWLENARCEMLRTQSVSYAELEKRGIYFVVARLNLRYRKAARYDDQIRIVIRQTAGTSVKVEHEYAIYRGDELLTEADSTLVCVDASGRPRVIPSELAI